MLSKFTAALGLGKRKTSPRTRTKGWSARPQRKPLRFAGRAAFALILLLPLVLPAKAESPAWSPASVWVWDPPFDTASPRTRQPYNALAASTREWKICASIPHLKDAYWLGVNYGLVDEAKRLNVTLKIFAAGGYGNLGTQIKQIEDCLGNGSDALIVSAIDFDKLNPTLEKAHAEGIPVIDLINGVSFPQVAAKSLGDFYDNGFAVGRYLTERHKESPETVRVLWFPGPKGAGWVTRGDQGFKDALKESNIEIIATSYGDTGKKAQGKLIEADLESNSDVDYIVGTAVTAEAAVDIVRRKRLKGRTGILAYYFGPGVYRGLKRGTIVAAPSDLPAIQARIALDQTVRILEGKPYMKHVGPEIVVIDRESLKDFDLSTSLAPKGFKATFDVN